MKAYVRYAIFLLTSTLCWGSNVPKLPHCEEKHPDGLVLVNTLDGKLTVLDNNDGKHLWEMDTGPGAMLSSNIDRLELTNNGHWVRIIPSLAGNLYKFNGDTIDPIPLTADNLLTASFQYSDDLVIVGGKEIRTYGVTLNSGKLIYECSLSGCVNKTKNNNFEDFILIERNTHTIRAVESRFGNERWNFSVGQMNIKLPQLSCRKDNVRNTIVFNLKPVVSEGLVYAFGESQKILWKQKFENPIVNIWTWDGNSLKKINMFTNTQYSWSLSNVNSNLSPSIYVGMHNKQLYVQESDLMQRFLSSNTNNNAVDITEIKSVSQIPWKPFPATSSALLVIDSEKSLTGTDKDDTDIATDIPTTALSVLYASEYINGNGFYLYPNEVVSEKCDDNKTIEIFDDIDEIDDDETPIQVIIVSLWYWWKEVLTITVSTTLLFNVLVLKPYLRKHKEVKTVVIERHIPMTDPGDTFKRTNSESSTDKEFVSRYLNDFNPVRCLGKGGFGIVFEAQNKIDDCNYAVKRITLPNKQESRDRVMREVKTLAKLEHRNIVRYFNAWLETPPPEWIANFDHEWKKDVLSSDGYDFTTTPLTPTPIKRINSSIVIDMAQNTSNKLYSMSELKKEESVDDSFIVFENTGNDTGNDTENGSKKTIGERRRDGESTVAINCTTESYDLLNRSRSNNNLPMLSSGDGTIFLYIQMQLCRKESLRDWLKDNIVRKRENIHDMFSQIVSAVEYVHNNGLIHRDLKPSNIFFSINGEIKVGDFGLVTECEECMDDYDTDEDNYEFNDDKRKFRKHTKAVGTQLYMSPEQLKGLSYNYKVDIYSLGVILFELLYPFSTTMERNKTLLDLRKNQFPKTFEKNYQKEHDLVSKMLSEIPERRPNSTEIRTMFDGDLKMFKHLMS